MAVDSGLPEFENLLSPIRSELNQLRQSLHQNDDEIDALQIASQKAIRPWYRDISVLVALSAFLFSLLTTAFSYYIANQQQVQSNKTELRSLLQRITSLNSEYDQLLSGGEKSQYSGSRSDAIITELILLSNQADELMERIPPDFLSMIEYYSVANAFVKNLNPERAEAMFLKAIEASETPREKAIALRGYANFLAANGKPEKARQAYTDALAASQDSSSDYTLAALRDRFYTHINWAYYELSLQECLMAREQLKQASTVASQLRPSENDPVLLELNRLRQSAESCTGS
jgi:tetratricopeptide (TPR) repeat protein